MLKLVDLANRPDFEAAPLRISPARRLVEGPAGRSTVEPIVMKVFLLLLDARGGVVTRDELFAHAWGGVFVGDDSLNRAIGRVRKIAQEAAPGLFEIETIPRTGYRITGPIVESLDQRAAGEPRSAMDTVVSRRTLIGSGMAAAVVAGGVGLWSARDSQEDRRFAALMDGADQALRYGASTSANKAVQYLQPAAAMRPDDPRASGLLAYAQSMVSEYGEPREAGAVAQSAERSARAALALDPKEPYARLALVTLQRSLLDLAETDARLREIVAAAPNDTNLMRPLWDLLQSTGQSRAAGRVNERAMSLDPLAAANNYPRAQLLWIVGQNAEADRVIDRAMQFWPEHPWVRFARFTIYAYTGRPRAALAMLEDDKLRPQHFVPAQIAAWRVSLPALDERSPRKIAAALTANLEMVKQAPWLASQAVLTLSALGEINTAFDIANDLLLFRRPAELRPQAGPARQPAKSTGWRFTPWLFTPPAEPMRKDPRFITLCDGIGLTEYWRTRGVRPDYSIGAG